MAGLLDGIFGGGSGIMGYSQPPMTEYNPPNAQPPGFMDRLNSGLSSPLTQFGLGLASGKTPQEGLGNAAHFSMYAGQVQQKQQAAQQEKIAAYRAAIAAGATPEQAQALASNPAAFKALQPSYHTTTGILGEQNLMAISPFGKVSQVGGGGGGAGTQGPATETNYDENGKDQGFLDAIRKQYGPTAAADIVGVSEGRAPTTGRNMQNLLKLAMRYDKNFTGAQDYATRLQTAKSFAPGGKDYANVKSYNQAMIHAEQAWDLIPKIEGFGVGGMVGKIINTPYGEARAATDPDFASNRARYDNVINALSGELSKAAKSTGAVSVDEIRAWRKNATSASSGAEMRGALQGGMDFLHGAMEATAKGHSEGLKSKLQPTQLLGPDQEKVFNRIRDYQEGGKNAAPPAGVPEAKVPQGARQAPDGNFYIPDPNRPGKYLKVVQ